MVVKWINTSRTYLQINCEVKEEPMTFQNLFETLNARLQNTTQVVENILGVDIPSTQDEVKTALQDNLNGLKNNAEKIQKKVRHCIYYWVSLLISGLFSENQSVP